MAIHFIDAARHTSVISSSIFRTSASISSNLDLMPGISLFSRDSSYRKGQIQHVNTTEKKIAVINTNSHTPLENKAFVAATEENFANALLTEEADENL